MVGVDGEPGAGGELRGLLAQRRHVDLVPAAERELGESVHLVDGEHVRAHPLELGDRLVVHRVVDDAGLLGRADHRGVEGLGDQDVDHGARHVGGLVEVDRGVARPDAQTRLAGGVRQGDDLGAAGDPDEVDRRVLEQVVRDLVGAVRDHLQRAGRQAGGLGGLATRISTLRSQHRTAYGDGRNTIALRVFAATMAL